MPPRKLRVTPKKKPQPQKPPASKVVSFVVSVGADDTRTMEQFLTALKDAISGVEEMDQILVSVDQASYSLVEGYDTLYFTPEDWEAWDGHPATRPLDRHAKLYGRDKADHTRVEPRSPREALEDLHTVLGRRVTTPVVARYEVELSQEKEEEEIPEPEVVKPPRQRAKRTARKSPTPEKPFGAF